MRKLFLTVVLVLITLTVSAQNLLTFDSFELHRVNQETIKGKTKSVLIFTEKEFFFTLGDNESIKFTYGDLFFEKEIEGHLFVVQGLESEQKERVLLFIRKDKEVVTMMDKERTVLFLFNKK